MERPRSGAAVLSPGKRRASGAGMPLAASRQRAALRAQARTASRTNESISMNDQEEGTRALRGFARMDPKRQREIARQGGRAAHRLGLAHEFTPEEARSARAKSLAARSAAAAALVAPPEAPSEPSDQRP